MKRPLDCCREVPADLRVDQGLRGKATAIEVPNLMRSLCSATSGNGRVRIVAGLGGPERVEPDVVGGPGRAPGSRSAKSERRRYRASWRSPPRRIVVIASPRGDNEGDRSTPAAARVQNSRGRRKGWMPGRGGTERTVELSGRIRERRDAVGDRCLPRVGVEDGREGDAASERGIEAKAREILLRGGARARRRSRAATRR